MARSGSCELCGRMVDYVTQHHLVPRTRHRNRRVRKSFGKEETQRVIWLCRPCHRNLHVALSEKQLAEHFNTLARLRRCPKVRKFTAWIRNKPAGTTVQMPRQSLRSRPG